MDRRWPRAIASEHAPRRIGEGLEESLVSRTCLFIWIALSRAAWAQEPAPAPVQPPAPAPAPPPAPEKQPAPEDQKDIESALSEDAAARAKSAAPAQPAADVGASALASLTPDLAFILDVSAAWFSEAENLQGGGHDPTSNGFNFQQLEMSVGKSVDPYFRFD